MAEIQKSVFRQEINDYCYLEATANVVLEKDKGLYEQTYFLVERVSDHDRVEIGHFYLSPMPGCCGIVVSHGAYLKEGFRHTGMSEPFRRIKSTVATLLGYSMQIATTDMANTPAVGSFLKSKYHIVTTFINKRTNHLIGLGYKKL